MKFDVMGDMDDFMKNNSETELDWVTALPVYQHLYNSTAQKSIGMIYLMLVAALLLLPCP